MSSQELNAELKRLRAEVASLKAELSERPKAPGDYPVPRSMEFCGEQIDLSPPEVRRRFKEELAQVLDQRRLMSNVLRRARLIFPVIEREARAVGGCGALKHLAVAESALRGGAASNKGAQGWWQFIASTAKQYKLTLTKDYDARRELRSSTRTAYTYLKVLHKAFGSWPLAMAAYNAGRGRVRSARKRQAQSSFWDLDLPLEAERYVPRILALSYVMNRLDEHDFRPQLDDGPIPNLVGLELTVKRDPFLEKVTVKPKRSKTSKRAKSSRRGKRSKRSKRSKKARRKASAKVIYRPSKQVSLETIAQVVGLELINLRHHNPALISAQLPLDTPFIIWVPPSGVEPLKRHLKAGLLKSKRLGPLYVGADAEEASPRAPLAQAEPPESSYEVQAGDSLFLISARFGISVERLRSWNQLSSSTPLRRGQLLKTSPP